MAQGAAARAQEEQRQYEMRVAAGQLTTGQLAASRAAGEGTATPLPPHGDPQEEPTLPPALSPALSPVLPAGHSEAPADRVKQSRLQPDESITQPVEQELIELMHVPLGERTAERDAAERRAATMEHAAAVLEGPPVPRLEGHGGERSAPQRGYSRQRSDTDWVPSKASQEALGGDGGGDATSWPGATATGKRKEAELGGLVAWESGEGSTSLVKQARREAARESGEGSTSLGKQARREAARESGRDGSRQRVGAGGRREGSVLGAEGPNGQSISAALDGGSVGGEAKKSQLVPVFVPVDNWFLMQGEPTRVHRSPITRLPASSWICTSALLHFCTTRVLYYCTTALLRFCITVLLYNSPLCICELVLFSLRSNGWMSGQIPALRAAPLGQSVATSVSLKG